MAENSFIDGRPFTAPHYVSLQSKFHGVPSTEDISLKYNMNHRRRGVALVFNHDTFNNTILKNRTGTERDVIALEETLQNLGFEYRLYTNSTKLDLLNTLALVAAEDHTDADCLVVVVLTHGGENRLCARDADYTVDDLCRPFTNSDTLAGKPKLFFLQACRGNRLDDGIWYNATEQSGLDTDDFQFCIPCMADISVNYSTVGGYVSYRESSGTPFIQALCAELDAKATTHHFEDVMLHVRRNVAFNYASKNVDISELHEKKQIPQIMSTLTKFIYFTRK